MTPKKELLAKEQPEFQLLDPDKPTTVVKGVMSNVGMAAALNQQAGEQAPQLTGNGSIRARGAVLAHQTQFGGEVEPEAKKQALEKQAKADQLEAAEAELKLKQAATTQELQLKTTQTQTEIANRQALGDAENEVARAKTQTSIESLYAQSQAEATAKATTTAADVSSMQTKAAAQADAALTEANASAQSRKIVSDATAQADISTAQAKAQSMGIESSARNTATLAEAAATASASQVKSAALVESIISQGAAEAASILEKAAAAKQAQEMGRSNSADNQKQGLLDKLKNQSGQTSEGWQPSDTTKKIMAGLGAGTIGALTWPLWLPVVGSIGGTILAAGLVGGGAAVAINKGPQWYKAWRERGQTDQEEASTDPAATTGNTRSATASSTSATAGRQPQAGSLEPEPVPGATDDAGQNQAAETEPAAETPFQPMSEEELLTFEKLHQEFLTGVPLSAENQPLYVELLNRFAAQVLHQDEMGAKLYQGLSVPILEAIQECNQHLTDLYAQFQAEPDNEALQAQCEQLEQELQGLQDLNQALNTEYQQRLEILGRSVQGLPTYLIHDEALRGFVEYVQEKYAYTQESPQPEEPEVEAEPADVNTSTPHEFEEGEFWEEGQEPVVPETHTDTAETSEPVDEYSFAKDLFDQYLKNETTWEQQRMALEAQLAELGHSLVELDKERNGHLIAFGENETLHEQIMRDWRITIQKITATEAAQALYRADLEKARRRYETEQDTLLAAVKQLNPVIAGDDKDLALFLQYFGQDTGPAVVFTHTEPQPNPEELSPETFAISWGEFADLWQIPANQTVLENGLLVQKIKAQWPTIRSWGDEELIGKIENILGTKFILDLDTQHNIESQPLPVETTSPVFTTAQIADVQDWVDISASRPDLDVITATYVMENRQLLEAMEAQGDVIVAQLAKTLLGKFGRQNGGNGFEHTHAGEPLNTSPSTNNGTETSDPSQPTIIFDAQSAHPTQGFAAERTDGENATSSGQMKIKLKDGFTPNSLSLDMALELLTTELLTTESDQPVLWTVANGQAYNLTLNNGMLTIEANGQITKLLVPPVEPEKWMRQVLEQVPGETETLKDRVGGLPQVETGTTSLSHKAYMEMYPTDAPYRTFIEATVDALSIQVGNDEFLEVNTDQFETLRIHQEQGILPTILAQAITDQKLRLASDAPVSVSESDRYFIDTVMEDITASSAGPLILQPERYARYLRLEQAGLIDQNLREAGRVLEALDEKVEGPQVISDSEQPKYEEIKATRDLWLKDKEPRYQDLSTLDLNRTALEDKEFEALHLERSALVRTLGFWDLTLKPTNVEPEENAATPQQKVIYEIKQRLDEEGITPEEADEALRESDRLIGEMKALLASNTLIEDDLKRQLEAQIMTCSRYLDDNSGDIPYGRLRQLKTNIKTLLEEYDSDWKPVVEAMHERLEQEAEQGWVNLGDDVIEGVVTELKVQPRDEYMERLRNLRRGDENVGKELVEQCIAPLFEIIDSGQRMKLDETASVEMMKLVEELYTRGILHTDIEDAIKSGQIQLSIPVPQAQQEPIQDRIIEAEVLETEAESVTTLNLVDVIVGDESTRTPEQYSALYQAEQYLFSLFEGDLPVKIEEIKQAINDPANSFANQLSENDRQYLTRMVEIMATKRMNHEQFYEYLDTNLAALVDALYPEGSSPFSAQAIENKSPEVLGHIAFFIITSNFDFNARQFLPEGEILLRKKGTYIQIEPHNNRDLEVLLEPKKFLNPSYKGRLNQQAGIVKTIAGGFHRSNIKIRLMHGPDVELDLVVGRDIGASMKHEVGHLENGIRIEADSDRKLHQFTTSVSKARTIANQYKLKVSYENYDEELPGIIDSFRTAIKDVTKASYLRAQDELTTDLLATGTMRDHLTKMTRRSSVEKNQVHNYDYFWQFFYDPEGKPSSDPQIKGNSLGHELAEIVTNAREDYFAQLSLQANYAQDVLDQLPEGRMKESIISVLLHEDLENWREKINQVLEQA